MAIYIKNNEAKVINLRKTLKDDFIKLLSYEVNYNSNNLILCDKHISYLFYLYDNYFFDNKLKPLFQNNISFSTSNRMSSAGGKTIYKKQRNNASFEIRVSVKILNNFYKTSCEKKVSGILVKDPIEALQIILEHEICHLIEFYYYGSSNCKGARFKKLSMDIFNHKSIYHELPTDKKIAMLMHPKTSLHIGDTVTFKFKDKEYIGVISNITKRATVMVNDKKGMYTDKSGQRFSKWYVPLNSLDIKECNK